MKYTHRLSLLILISGLAACGGGHDSNLSASSSSSSSGSSSSARGSLLQSPPELLSQVTAQTLSTELTSAANAQAAGAAVLADILNLVGVPKCDVNVYHIEYETVGGQSEATTASGALMVPSGSDPACSGARPIVLYAHGTNTLKTFNIADLSNSQNAEGVLLAAFFAASGYIVVAPNYAGYDTSTLPYHPFLIADQQSKDMIDALTAARTALQTAGTASSSAVTDGGKLFITGYSQGGYVAMATHRAMEAAGMTVTASAPLSGPYALEAYVDAEFAGQVSEGATVSATMLFDGYQNSYGNLYSQITDVISAQYATGFATLLPSTTSRSSLYSSGALPEFALFDATAPAPTYTSLTPATQPAGFASVFAQGFGAGNLIVNGYRLAWLQDESANPDGGFPAVTTGLPATSPQVAWRQDLMANDLRDWTPKAPTLLCGGDQDPTVFFFNTTLMQQYWINHPSTTPNAITVLDLNASSAPGVDGSLQTQFQTVATAYGITAGSAALNSAYHETLVPPFCLAAAISFFSGF